MLLFLKIKMWNALIRRISVKYLWDVVVGHLALPRACMAVLKHYGIDLSGKNVAVVGRSNVVGKPVAMLLLQQNATVTICHSRTQNLPEVLKQADISS